MVSVILAIYRNPKDITGFSHRMRNFVEVLHCLNNQTYRDKEIIIVEQYSNLPVFDHIFSNSSNYKYVPIKGDIYNLSWCHNVGAKLASGDLHLHYDGDIIVGNDYIEKLVADFNKDYIFGWSKKHRLSETATNNYLLTREYKSEWGNDDVVWTSSAGEQYGDNGGATLFEKDFFFNVIGGYNETYFGWGADDCDIMYRTRELSLDWNWFDYLALHLNHGELKLSGDGGNNREVLEVTFKFPGIISNRIKGNCGDPFTPQPLNLDDLWGK